jgi:hypothetical protein
MRTRTHPILSSWKHGTPARPRTAAGPWGYAEFLAAIADPAHQRHAELKEWLGKDFHPAAVDEAAIRKSLKVLAAPHSRRKASSSAKRAG